MHNIAIFVCVQCGCNKNRQQRERETHKQKNGLIVMNNVSLLTRMTTEKMLQQPEKKSIDSDRN